MAVEACQLLAYSGQVHPQPIITPPSSFLNNKLVSHAILTLEAEGEMTGTYNEGAPSAWRSNNGGWGASECCSLRDLDCWRNDWYPRRIGASQHLRLSTISGRWFQLKENFQMHILLGAPRCQDFLLTGHNGTS